MSSTLDEFIITFKTKDHWKFLSNMILKSIRLRKNMNLSVLCHFLHTLQEI